MRRLTIAAIVLLACCSRSTATPETPTSPTTSTPPAPAAPDPPAPTPTSTAVQLNDDLGGRRPFPSDNWWNLEITNAPLDPQSDALINFIGRTRTAHPDFGPPPYGIPYVGVGGAEPRTTVTFVDYGDESDHGFGSERGYPIPEAARTQPNVIEGGRAGGGTEGDRHLLIVDRDRWLL